MRSAHSASFRTVYIFVASLCLVLLFAHETYARGTDQAGSLGMTDILNFGSTESEYTHSLSAVNSGTGIGALGQSYRRLLPQDPADWQGGRTTFTMAVDPSKLNYFTIRLWGGETNVSRLVLFVADKQVGYLHIGDVDLLDFGNEDNELPLNGRFYYETSPLPLAMTRGKTNLQFSVQAIGRIWGYGGTFAQYQKIMDAPSRGLYSAYTHTNSFLTPPASETQGHISKTPPMRQQPGPEVLNEVKERVNKEISGELASRQPLNQMQMQFLARAYSVKWTKAYNNPDVPTLVAQGLDSVYMRYRQDPNLMKSDPSTPNPGWFGFGPAGDAVWLLRDELAPVLDVSIDNGVGGSVKRRDAWAEMLRASCDWNSKHRRQYTNQSIIVDMSIYMANQGIVAINKSMALPQATATHYLYQALGIEPWLGIETPTGPEKPLGDHYMELTRSGLSKELGYVGYYGEIIDWVAQVYDATRPRPDLPGDPKIKAQLEKIMHARFAFRYPALDTDGNRAMRVETIVGWRDDHYPGAVTYAERPSWDGSSIYGAADSLDPESVGAVQQMFRDNQFFNSVQSQMGQNYSLRVTAGLLGIPDQYALLNKQPVSKALLPMSFNQPNFSFADEEDGVVAIKNGSEILYVSLYWRARHSINFLARVHDITPAFDRIAVVHEDEVYNASGMTFTRPDDIVGTSFPPIGYPGNIHSAEAGEQEPIAAIPSDEKFKPGDENVHAGRANFYVLKYGPYTIAMNSTSNKTFTLTAPGEQRQVTNLVTKARVRPGEKIAIAPMSTTILYAGQPVR